MHLILTEGINVFFWTIHHKGGKTSCLENLKRKVKIVTRITDDNEFPERQKINSTIFQVSEESSSEQNSMF